MSDLVDLIKTILGFRLVFPSWVKFNLNKAILDLTRDMDSPYKVNGTYIV